MESDLTFKSLRFWKERRIKVGPKKYFRFLGWANVRNLQVCTVKMNMDKTKLKKS